MDKEKAAKNLRDALWGVVTQQELELLGVVSLKYELDFKRYRTWIEQRQHAGMAYLEKHQEIRKDPTRLVEGAKIAILIALPYCQGDSGKTDQEGNDHLRVAQYARFKDYHRVLKKKAESIIFQLREMCGDQKKHVWRFFSDTAPLLERALAAQTSQGFIGKNTCYIHPKWGSYLLLGEILTSFPMPTDQEISQKGQALKRSTSCGVCNLCQINCPTGALSREYSVDANKCHSYWTTEHRGSIPFNQWAHFAQYYFGCDVCQLVCPYCANLTATKSFSNIEKRDFPSLDKIAVMTQAEYEKFFGGTSMIRAGRNGLRRNVLIAMAVTKDVRLSEVLDKLVSDTEPVIVQTIVQIREYLKQHP